MVGWLELRLGLSSGVWIGGRILVGGLVVLVEVGNGLEVDFFLVVLVVEGAGNEEEEGGDVGISHFLEWFWV